MLISDTVVLGSTLLFDCRLVVRKENRLEFSFFILRSLRTIMNDVSVQVVSSNVSCLISSLVHIKLNLSNLHVVTGT
jgi:hypothetical protein